MITNILFVGVDHEDPNGEAQVLELLNEYKPPYVGVEFYYDPLEVAHRLEQFKTLNTQDLPSLLETGALDAKSEAGPLLKEGHNLRTAVLLYAALGFEMAASYRYCTEVGATMVYADVEHQKQKILPGHREKELALRDRRLRMTPREYRADVAELYAADSYVDYSGPTDTEFLQTLQLRDQAMASVLMRAMQGRHGPSGIAPAQAPGPHSMRGVLGSSLGLGDHLSRDTGPVIDYGPPKQRLAKDLLVHIGGLGHMYPYGAGPCLPDIMANRGVNVRVIKLSEADRILEGGSLFP